MSRFMRMFIFLVSSSTGGGAIQLMATMNKTVGVFYDWSVDGISSISITDGASIYQYQDHGDIRSGNPNQVNDLVFPGTLSAVAASEQLTVDYKYVAGYGCVGTSGGSTFDLKVAGATVATQGPFEDYPYDACSGAGCDTCYSPVVTFSVPGPLSSGEVRISVSNNNRNIHLVDIVIQTVSSGAAATGDPHMRNVLGERFDLMKPGRHVLVTIPRFQPAESALLHVEADARKMGGYCSDMYFRQLNITGSWAEAKRTGGLHFDARDVRHETAKWEHFGHVDVKVVHARTLGGLEYLNFYVKNLGRAGFAVGGLLGMDDHTEAAMPSEGCHNTLSLKEILQHQNRQESPDVSIGEASLNGDM